MKKVKRRRLVDSIYEFPKIKCPNCGHTQKIWKRFCLCDNCQTILFRNKKEEFDYKIKRRLGKQRNEKINN